MQNKLVKDWMTHDVLTITPDTLLPDATELMQDNNIRRLPVVDQEGKLIGILSRSDVLEAKPSDATKLNIWEINYLLSRLKVEKVMTPFPHTVTPHSTIKEVAQLMYRYKVGGVPVVDDDNHVVGIITESDILRLLIAWFEETEK